MPRSLDVGVGTAVLIFNDLGQLLLLKRAGAHWADYWGVPGGWVDRADSSTELAVIREAEEEVGLILREVARYTWTTEDNPEIGCRTITLYHVAHPGTWNGDAKIMEPQKCSELRWVYRNELPEKLFPGLREVILEFPDHTAFRTADNSKRPLLVGGSLRNPNEIVQRVRIHYVKNGKSDSFITGHKNQTWGTLHNYITKQLEPDGFICGNIEILP